MKEIDKEVAYKRQLKELIDLLHSAHMLPKIDDSDDLVNSIQVRIEEVHFTAKQPINSESTNLQETIQRMSQSTG